MDTVSRDSAMMREASRLAASGGDPGSSDAIRLLRIFDKYTLTGKTYTTAGGQVIPNELQYYSGEMAHFYGECTNISAVNEALAGSGYKALILKYPDGRQAAAAQLWSSRFTDTSIGPYGAMFLVVIVVPDGALSTQVSLRADPNGASSALVMLDGSFDPGTGVYENKARLFLVRLLDTTQVAIDVGRERMGTDKRPGAVDMTRDGRRLRVSIKDQLGRGVVRADLELADDPAAYMPEVARAAATAGIPFRALPPGTEYAYPAVARIGQGPVVSWQWRTDVVPRLQPVVPGTVAFDQRSEEGRMLVTWGFTPKVLGYIPSVRGVVTGLADPGVRGLAEPLVRLHQTVTARPNGGNRPRLVTASPELRARADHVPLLRAVLPGQSAAKAGHLPVLRLIAQELSPRAATAVPREPRWIWDTTFLGSLTASLRKEVVGVTPDGLRINWHVKTGTFVGPGLDAIVLPGAADWMRIRRDGIAIVNVQACFETREGVLVYGSYGGVFDLGPDGYARALRDEYDDLPPVVVTPTYATADPRLGWLNRAQCLGVGRVDMSALRVEFDVYVVRVGGPVGRAARNGTARAGARQSATLYTRLGGHDVIVAVTEDFVAAVLADTQLARFFPNAQAQPGLKELKDRVVELLCEITGGPCAYKGRDMKAAHKGLGINEVDWTIAVDLFTAALYKSNIPPQERSEFVRLIEDMKSQIVEVPGRP